MFLSCLYKSFSLFCILYISLYLVSINLFLFLYTSFSIPLSLFLLLYSSFSFFSLSFSPHRFSDDLDLEDALHIAILALKEGFEGLMSATNIEIGVTHEGRFHILTPEQISEYLTNI